MKVQCPSCKKQCHETTDAYDPSILANGSMVCLLDPWKSWGWGKFGNDGAASASVLASEMFCPCCDGLLAPGGRLAVIKKPLADTLRDMGAVNQATIEFYDDVVTIVDGKEVFSIDEPDPLECPECGWEGKTTPALKRHMTMRHN